MTTPNTTTTTGTSTNTSTNSAATSAATSSSSSLASTEVKVQATTHDDIAKSLSGQHCISIKQFSRTQIDYIFAVASWMDRMVTKNGSCELAKGKLLVNLFYEPSTRTSSSFHAAMMRLGGMVLPITDVTNSSVAKGESLPDTVRALQSYSDVIVLRHPIMGSASLAASYLNIPLINAGDGIGEHPTQALLDTYTILSELGTIDGLTITMVGDLKHGRTVHSLARILSHYKGVTINYVSPDFLAMPHEVTDEVKSRGGVSQHAYTSLTQCLPTTDVLYVTRVQKERFADPAEYEKSALLYVITPSLLTDLKAKSSMRILHPLPRVGELSPEVDADPRAAYFRQMRCGLFVRMALLAVLLGRTPPSNELTSSSPSPVALTTTSASPSSNPSPAPPSTAAH